MDAEFYWSLFLDTGAPEAFLLYKGSKTKKGNSNEEILDHSPVCHGDLSGSGIIGL